MVFLSFFAEVTPQALIMDLISSYQLAFSFQPVSETQFAVPKIKLSDAGSSTFSFSMLWIHFLRSLTLHFRLKTSFGPHFLRVFKTLVPIRWAFAKKAEKSILQSLLKIQWKEIAQGEIVIVHINIMTIGYQSL